MTAEVADLAVHRALRELQHQLAAVAAESAALKLRLQPEVASKVLMALAVEDREEFASRLAKARAPLLELLALLLAEQQVVGDTLDPLRALAVAFGDSRFCLDMPQLVAECLDTLPVAYDQLRRRYGPHALDE